MVIRCIELLSRYIMWKCTKFVRSDGDNQTELQVPDKTIEELGKVRDWVLAKVVELTVGSGVRVTDPVKRTV